MDNGSDETNELKGNPIAPQGEEVVELGTLRILNEAAVRDHALECSKKFRGGKFTRVGQDFLDEVRADVESMIRALDTAGGNTSPNEFLNPGELGFTTGALSDRVMEKWNLVIAKIIQRKVQRQPSVGKTLSRTR